MKTDGGRGPVLSRIRTSAVASIAFALLLFYALKLGSTSMYSLLFTQVSQVASGDVVAETITTETSNSSTLLAIKDPSQFDEKIEELKEKEAEEKKKLEQARQAKINKVEAFFKEYGAVMQGYGHILVDQAEKCGGDYKVLVGIAGSESGLGRVMYKSYNPFGYLDGVQYASMEEAIEVLSCKISQQHIAPCNGDLNCIAERYTGQHDDLGHFVSKVRWFMDQVS